NALLQPEEVNQAINRAHVGLCLSPSEGAMFASTEYLLAGMPVVTTESEGGREVLFDDQYCSIVADDPAAIAEAVCHWKQRAPDPAHIRAKTLEKMMPHRARLGNLVKKILAHHGAHAAAAKWLIPTLPNKLAGHRYLTEDSNLKALRKAAAGFSVRLHTIKNSVTGLLKSKKHTAMALTHSVMQD
ncbi:MAG: glycosyltransferase, partial [Verrucomicrobiales bacterium]